MASTIMESLFQRTLDDLVKGLRVQMIGEGRFIANHLEEIRKEIKSTDAHTKSVALQKLTYINMLHGVDMEWAAFHVIEVMSMTKFAHKKIGYLAASQSFHEDLDVLLLITNQLRKDLGSTNELEVGLALECLSCIATPDLARELTSEVFSLLANGRVYVRKKATLALLKLFSRYPEGVRIAFKRLVEKMDDPDSQVVSAAVSVLCEMAMKDPRTYLPLAPELHKLLVDSKSNWLTIKVVKIFGVLAPLEPRLGRKIAEPVCEQMRRTGAKSLLLECIRTVIAGLPDHPGAMKVAVEKLKGLLEEDDPNLQYLGLQALAALMPAHPRVVVDCKSIIIRCLSDGDSSIQMASLKLIMGMVSENNLIETVQVLMQYAKKSDLNLCNEVIGAILATCSRGLYELVQDFSWYVEVLGDIGRIPDSIHGRELERQFVDIGLRVKDVRRDLLHVARGLLLDPTLLKHPSLHRVLSALAWIAGEYVEFSQNPYELIEALLQPGMKLLPSSVHVVYLQAALKVFVHFSFLSLKCMLQPTAVQVVTSDFDLLNMEDSTVRKQPQTVGEVSASGEVNRVFSSLDGSETQTTSTPTAGQEQVEAIVIEASSCEQHVQVEHESLDRIIELIESNVGPLTQSVDVEVQERACNLLGVVKALRGYMISSVESESLSKDKQEDLQRAFELVESLKGMFSHDLGPVSVFAQGRVTVPDGLVLEETLDSLDGMFMDEESSGAKLKGWGIEKPDERDDRPIFVQRAEQDSLQTGESASLLAQHRQRHGTYYLSTDKEVLKVNEYPPPQIAPFDMPSTSQANKDIVKLAEESIVWTKPRRPKARPVVVKLDDAEEVLVQSVKSKKDLKDDFISSAIRDVLSGDKNRPFSKPTGLTSTESGALGTSNHHHRKSQRQSRRHDQLSNTEVDGKLLTESPVAPLVVDETAERDSGKVERRASNKYRHLKPSKSLSKDSNLSGVEQGTKGKSRESHMSRQQSGRKSRQRIKSPVDLTPQTPVIPDFLL